MYSGAVVYGAKNQSRCLAAVKGDHEHHRFFVGAAGLRDYPQNELLLLEYSEETNKLREASAYSHPGEIWHISPSPRDSSLCFTSSTRRGADPLCTLWRLSLPEFPHSPPSSPSKDAGDVPRSTTRHSPTQQAFTTSFLAGEGAKKSTKAQHRLIKGSRDQSMEPLITLPVDNDANKSRGGGGRVRCVLWGPEQETNGKVLAVDGEKARLYALQGSSDAQEMSNFDLGVEEKGEVQAAAWDPHDPWKVAIAQGRGIRHLDMRMEQATGMTETEQSSGFCHRFGVKDVDFNHAKPYCFVTGGEDRLIKFWDIRRTGQGPVKRLAGHAHWVWTVKYNPCHDQLLLSAGTDNLVNLWRISSISSAPLWEPEEGPEAPDVRVLAIQDHEESVYAVDWSACDPFLFASLSYDGRVVVNAVPPSEKYKILL